MTARDHMCLTLAAQHFRFPGARATAIREQVGMSEVRHAQVVLSLLDRPDVEAEYPQLVHRLRRLRDARRSERHAARAS